MNFKKMITLIEFLALTGVMSVGFSTWVIVQTKFPDFTIEAETENVYNMDDYLEIRNIMLSDYKDNGFYNEFDFNAAVVNYAYLYIDLYVDVNSWSNAYSQTLPLLQFNISITSAKIASYVSKNLTCEHTSPNFSESFSSTSAVKNGNMWNDSFNITYSNVSSLSSFVINLKYKLEPNNVSSLITALKQDGAAVKVSASMGGAK